MKISKRCNPSILRESMFPMQNTTMSLVSHLRGLWTVELLPQQDPKVTEREERPEHVACLVLQSAAGQQRIKQDWIVEDGDYLHVL